MREAVEWGEGFFNLPTKVEGFAEQVMMLSGFVHRLSEADSPEEQVNMLVEMPEEVEWVVTDRGYDMATATTVFALRKVGEDRFHIVSVRYGPDENGEGQYTFIFPTTEDSLDVLTKLIQEGNWNVAA